MAKKIIKSHVLRSAKTGKFTTGRNVKKNPSTTVRETVVKKSCC